MLDREPPVRLCCFQRHWGVVCPDGLVMCELCFGRFLQDDLYIEADGQKVNICRDCGEREADARPAV